MFVFKVRYINGVLTPHKRDRASYEGLLNAFKKSEEYFVLEIKKDVKTVNTRQIKLYKAIVYEASEKTGHTFNEIETALFNKFLPKEIKQGLMGSYFERVEIESLNTLQFNSFIKQAVIYLNEFFNLKISLNE